MQFFESNGHQIFGHSGGHYGVGTEWSVYKDLGYNIIVLTNRDAEQGFYDVRYFIRKQLTGSTPFVESYLHTNKIIDIVQQEGYEKAKKIAQESDVELLEDLINYKGYQFLSQEQYQQAIDSFKLQVLLFESSYNAYDSLAEAYMKSGKDQLAVKNYTYSLKLNPKNVNAIKQLELIKKTQNK